MMTGFGDWRNEINTGYYGYATHLPMFDELCDTADEQQLLFDSMQTNDFHTLHSLLPPESTASQNYSLRPCVHNVQLPDHPIISLTLTLSRGCYLETFTNILLCQ